MTRYLNVFRNRLHPFEGRVDDDLFMVVRILCSTLALSTLSLAARMITMFH